MKNLLFGLFYFSLSYSLIAATHPFWEEGTLIESPRENLYELSPNAFNKVVMEGRRHALIYPVTASQLTIPYWPLKNFFESEPESEVRRLLFQAAKVISPFKSMEDVFSWLGLHDYPLYPQAQTPNPLPDLTPEERSLPMGATIFKTENGEGLTFSCATCHSGDLFGVKVLGLTNRFPRANEFFRRGARLAPYVNSFLFQDFLNTTEGERLLLKDAKKNLRYVGTKSPVSIGLDTSLAQVALSLAKRKDDEFATPTALSHRFPRSHPLEKKVADSKPAVWWNLKYKNRWLSDGSIVSGNPVHTNFLWNEIGRGTDLKELEKWLVENPNVIQELTAAVFASRSPRYEKFFGVESIKIEKAKRGQLHYQRSCQKCHGIYEKGWDHPEATSLSREELLQNTKVTYHQKTPVIDVGTDPGRYLGMEELSKSLNKLKISKTIGAKVVTQKGYVPPPLDGIWSRWPYFHNNSVPNLCALLTSAKKRPKTFWTGKALLKERDFDQTCVGYPTGGQTPSHWKEDPDYLFDTTKEGLSNSGHDEKIFLKDGKEIYTPEEKLELIEFLKTL